MKSSSEGQATPGTDKGNLIGFVVLTGFGAVWWLMAAGQLDGGVRIALLALGSVILAGLIARMVMATEGAVATSTPAGADIDRRDREFRTIGIIETVAILVGVFGLSRLSHPEWIPVWCALVIGVHFMPLARVFDVAEYRVTGLAFVALAILVSTLVPLLNGPRQAWFVSTGLGAALILWATCGYLALKGPTRSP